MDPYVSFTGRVYNDRLVAGVVRAKQGMVCALCLEGHPAFGIVCDEYQSVPELPEYQSILCSGVCNP